MNKKNKVIIFVKSIAILLSALYVLQFEYSHAATTNNRKPAATTKVRKKKKAAVQQKKHAATRSKTTRRAAPAKTKTVADLLKNIEKKSEKVNFKKTQSALPSFSQQKSAPAKVNLTRVKPPSSKKLYYEEGTDEAALEQTTDEGIQQLYKLAQQYKKSSKRGELWLRLAEMYVEKSRLIEYKILNQHDVDMQAYLSGKTKRKPKLNLSPAVAYNKKAIQLYEWYLRDFPKDPKNDQALFFLGFNYFELNEPKRGQVYYEKLTREYPNSLYVSESNFALGEYHFENERWKDALKYYHEVAKQKNSRLYTFALYKIAWCDYKLNNSKLGLRYLEQVILEGRKSKGQRDKSTSGVSRIRLATEAIKDLIVFFADAGDYKNARPYFERVVGEKSANANLAKLAYYYSDTGNRQAGRAIFKDLIDQEPNSIRAYDYEYAIVKMLSAGGNTQAFKSELYSWIENYGPGSSWQRINAKDKAALNKANDLMESLLRNQVLLQHQVAQNSRTKSTMAVAQSGYELYFNTFKTGPKAEEMHFFYGELLFDAGDYQKAAYHYKWVTDNAPKSQYYDKALLNTLLAYEKRLPPESKIKKIVGDTTEPIEFDGSVKDFENAALTYLEKAPKSENAVATQYRLGALYYLFNQFDKAIPVLTEIVKRHSKTPYAKFSANHLLDIYNLRKDYIGLQATANDILAIPDLARSDVGAQIRDIKVKTDFKLAKELEDKKDYAGSAKAYEVFAIKNRASEMAPAAQFNSAVNYERAGEVAKAIGMYLSITHNTSKGSKEFAKKANKFLPILFEKTGQYQKAASLFEAYALSNPSDSVAEGYHFNAAVIYDGLNAYSSAIKNYELYFKKHRGRDKSEVLFLIAKIYQRKGQKDKAIAEFNSYIHSGSTNKAGIIEAYFTIAKLHESLGRKKATEEWYKKTISVQKNLSSDNKNLGASFAAEAKFNLVHRYYEDLVAFRIPANPAKQGAAVQKKLSILNILKDQLKRVVAYDDPFQIVAALSLQGQALQHMYVSLLSTPAPKGLKADELKQYQAGVEKIANPFKDQAIETYKTAIERGYDLMGYSNYLLTSIKNLNNLMGAEDPVVNTKVFVTKIPDWMEL